MNLPFLAALTSQAPHWKPPSWSGILLLWAVVLVCLGLLWLAISRLRSWMNKIQKERSLRDWQEREKYIRRGTAEHPVIGSYSFSEDTRSGESTWRSEYHSTVLGYAFAVCSYCIGPTPAQVERLQEVERRLPEIIAAIPPPPKNDGRGQSFTNHHSSVALISSVTIGSALGLGISMVYEPDPGNSYHLSPEVSITPDWRISAQWVV